MTASGATGTALGPRPASQASAGAAGAGGGAMQFGLVLPSFSFDDLTPERADRLTELARRAEALGFHSIWTCEHFVVAPGLYGVAWLSCLTTLAWVGAATQRIRLGTSILILP